jgi:endonuclease/exonuclease/phosphatase family metal-dependent hydrolase
MSNLLTVLQYNVDMAKVEEKYENTKWSNRSGRVIKTIRESGADIVCLQELRKLPSEHSSDPDLRSGYPPITVFLSNVKFVSSRSDSELEEYKFELAYRNSEPGAFGQAILYNPEKWMVVDTKRVWLNQVDEYTNPDYEYMAFGVLFRNVVPDTTPNSRNKTKPGDKQLFVWNVHFGMDEQVKTDSCKTLLRLRNEIYPEVPTLICGDFNFFDDRDGKQQRELLTAFNRVTRIGNDRQSLVDFGENMVTSQNQTQISGTFVGFEHNEFKAPLPGLASRLDHVFGSPGDFELDSTPVLLTKTYIDPEPEELTSRDLPSDHLALKVVLRLSS